MKKIQLQLTSPCLQQWEDLVPDGAGRYCGVCEKHVVDLSCLTDAELISFFKHKKKNICGKVLSSQLNRELVVPSKKSWHWLLPMAIGAVLVSPAQASQLVMAKVQTAHRQKSGSPTFQDTPAVTSQVSIVNGTVVDKGSGKPLVGVKIREKGFANVLAITDKAGRFHLETEKLEGIVFIFVMEGYDLAETRLSDGMVLSMAVERVVRLGGIHTISLDREPLYLIYAGKKSCKIDAARLKEISPDWIEKIDVLKDAKATALYGAKAANGAILIGIKKKYARKIDFSSKD